MYNKQSKRIAAKQLLFIVPIVYIVCIVEIAERTNYLSRFQKIFGCQQVGVLFCGSLPFVFRLVRWPATRIRFSVAIP